MRTYAARAPVNARVSASASVKSATNASAPLLTKLCNLFALLPTTRTFCLLASRVLAMIDPVLPVAPRMVYIKSPFKALCLDARLGDEGTCSRANLRPASATRKECPVSEVRRQNLPPQVVVGARFSASPFTPRTTVTGQELQQNSFAGRGLLVLRHALREPPKVFRQSSDERQNDNLRRLIAVELQNSCLKRGQSALRRFDHQHDFARLLDPAFPPINGLDWPEQAAHACREPPLDELARDSPRFCQ